MSSRAGGFIPPDAGVGGTSRGVGGVSGRGGKPPGSSDEASHGAAVRSPTSRRGPNNGSVRFAAGADNAHGPAGSGRSSCRGTASCGRDSALRSRAFTAPRTSEYIAELSRNRTSLLVG